MESTKDKRILKSKTLFFVKDLEVVKEKDMLKGQVFSRFIHFHEQMNEQLGGLNVHKEQTSNHYKIR